MKKLFFSCTVLIFLINTSWSLDCSGIVLNSNRSRNPFLLNILLTQDLTDQLCILTFLGRRADSYVEDFIFGLIDHMTGPVKERYEYLLRVLLFSVFNPTFEPDELAARILLNKKGIDYCMANFHTFNDPMLKCQIMWIIPYLHDVSSLGIYMTEGKYLLSVLKQTKGLPGNLINEEIICLLESIQYTGDSDYLDLCHSFVRLSMEKRVVDEARETIRVLLLREEE